MAKRQSFPIVLNGAPQDLGVTLKWTGKVVVDMNGQQIAKKTDWMGTMDVVTDYQGHQIAVVKQMRNFRVAIDGRYIDTNEPFTPLAAMPGIIKAGMAIAIIILIISFVLGGGVFGALVGIVGYLILTAVGRSSMSNGGKIGASIAVIAGMCIAYGIIFMMLVAAVVTGLI